MIHLIFYAPCIPGNTGAAIRLAACTGSLLHLVEPLGFEMDDTKLRRAGLDYHDLAHVKVHSSFEELLPQLPGNLWAFTGHAKRFHTDVAYQDGDALLFGPEPTGLPEEILYHQAVTDQIRIPMLPGLRSLNLANSASIGLYEAWRQLDFPGGV